MTAFLSRTNKTYSRCHLDSRDSRALSGIHKYPRQLTYAHTLQNTLRCPAFDCTLRGPFDDLFLTRLSATRALWKGMIAVISASTVCMIELNVFYHLYSALSTRNFTNLARKISPEIPGIFLHYDSTMVNTTPLMEFSFSTYSGMFFTLGIVR